MKPFRDKADFVATLSVLWDRIVTTPEIVQRLSTTRLLARFRFPDYQTDLYIDARDGGLRYYWDPQEIPRFDVEMILSSEVSHQFWMERLNIPLAIAGRKIIAKGSVQKALRLLPALKPAFALYPQVLRDMGKEALLTEQGVTRRRVGFRWFARRSRRTYDPNVLPMFPMEFVKDMPQEHLAKRYGTVERVPDTELLRTMYRIRFFEQHLSEAFREGRIPTEAIHLSIGQEAVAAGVCLNLRDTDYLNTTHRGHGHILAKGVDMNRVMAEIYGKAAGPCGGKGGSMHVTDASKSILGANGIVGAGYLLAMGAGFSIRRQRRDDISVVIAGDGSVNQGMFHEALNVISLLRLPVLIVVENNRYGEFTPVERHSAVPEIYKRAAAYNIEACRINGNDVREVYETVREIVEAMRRDGRPRFLELMTYRWHGHMEGDPELYRTKEEKDRFQREDPILRLERELLNRVGERALENLRRDAEDEIRRAVDFAQQADPPPSSALMSDVYAPEISERYQGSWGTVGEGEVFREISTAQAVNEAIAEEMAADDRVFLWGEDVALGGYFNVTDGLVDRFGKDRVIDTPISENAIVGGAVGAAMTGLRPVVEILFADFLSCCMDPILNQAAKLRYMTGGQVAVPLTIRTPLGSGIGMAAQHSQSMEKFFYGIPGLIVVTAADAYAAKGLLKSAISSDNPVLFFEHKLLYASVAKVPDQEYTLPLGKARIVLSGADVTIVSYLLGVTIALDAARLLETKGIRAEVIDLATLYPLDTPTILESLQKTRHLVTIEEGTATGGIGAEVIARVVTAGFGLLKSPPLRIAAPECPVPYAKNLESALLPEPQDIADRIARALR